MSDYITFKDVVNSFRDFASEHEQINDFGFGDISDINVGEHLYPMIWLNPVNSDKNGVHTTLRFDMYVLDIIEQDKTNLLDVMNDTLIIGNDCVSNFWMDSEELLGFELNEEAVSLTPFEGKFDSLLGSWIFNIEIDMKITLNKCAIPVQ